MEKQQAWRLSTMERNQVETNKRLDESNKRLDDVLKTNMNLQQMLLSVLSNISGKDNRKDGIADSCTVQIRGETSENGAGNIPGVNASSGEKEYSEQWWNDLDRKSGDEGAVKNVERNEVSASGRPQSQVSLNINRTSFDIN